MFCMYFGILGSSGVTNLQLPNSHVLKLKNLKLDHHLSQLTIEIITVQVKASIVKPATAFT